MELKRTLTSTVYIIHENKVLLHVHKKFNSLFPIGGHMLPDELPHQAAIREAMEESGLEIEIYNKDSILPLLKVRQLIRPAHMLLENIGHEVENIDFIYYAKAKTSNVKPLLGESEELFWFSEAEVEKNSNIMDHIKVMALDSIKSVK